MLNETLSNETFLNETEAAKLLSLSKQTLSNWRYARRGLNYLKLGGRVVYRLSDIQEWVEKSLVEVER